VAQDEDERLMAAALELSRRSLGLAMPNPSVGAIVVKDGRLVGRGVTNPGGRPHAETQALLEAGELAKGATLYVTLEPCSHHGQTPPCTEAIISAGIARVVAALEDPNPKVAGGGYALLRAAGIEVVSGLQQDKATRLHLGHIMNVTAGRPMVTLKLAETADGYAAGLPGEPRLSITGPLANDFVHMQRAMHDAILVGIGTVLADDPLLNVRLPGLETRKPLRIVLDTKLRLPLDARLVVTAANIPTLVIASEGASRSTMAALASKHIEIAMLPCDEAGHLSLQAVLALLATRGITRVFCEGGPRMGQALIASGFADDVILLKSADVFGREGLPALDDDSRAKLTNPKFYSCAETRVFGDAGGDRLTRFERKI
jgi:diaminohydroxyphosphoribosylaminopyrimidine deaminase/5-amino-6-(5-phosphoribosylamino)uracil reductase